MVRWAGSPEEPSAGSDHCLSPGEKGLPRVQRLGLARGGVVLAPGLILSITRCGPKIKALEAHEQVTGTWAGPGPGVGPASTEAVRWPPTPDVERTVATLDLGLGKTRTCTEISALLPGCQLPRGPQVTNIGVRELQVFFCMCVTNKVTDEQSRIFVCF